MILAITFLAAESTLGWAQDFLVDASPHVAVTATASSEPLPREGRARKLRRIEALKGRPPEEARYEDYGEDARDRDYLVFFEDDGRVRQVIDLSCSSKWSGIAFTQDFKVLGTRDAILTAARARLKRPAAVNPSVSWFSKAWKGYLLAQVPWESPAHARLYAGSLCYLVLPPDPENEARVHTWAADNNVNRRAEAARMLVNYPGKKSEALLRTLLADPASADYGKGQRYPAREAAYDALRALDLPAEKPAGYPKEPE